MLQPNLIIPTEIQWQAISLLAVVFFLIWFAWNTIKKLDKNLILSKDLKDTFVTYDSYQNYFLLGGIAVFLLEYVVIITGYDFKITNSFKVIFGLMLLSIWGLSYKINRLYLKLPIIFRIFYVAYFFFLSLSYAFIYQEVIILLGVLDILI